MSVVSAPEAVPCQMLYPVTGAIAPGALQLSVASEPSRVAVSPVAGPGVSDQLPSPVARSKLVSAGCPLLPRIMSRKGRSAGLAYTRSALTSAPETAEFAAVIAVEALVPPTVHQPDWRS